MPRCLGKAPGSLLSQLSAADFGSLWRHRAARRSPKPVLSPGAAGSDEPGEASPEDQDLAPAPRGGGGSRGSLTPPRRTAAERSHPSGSIAVLSAALLQRVPSKGQKTERVLKQQS